MSAVFSTIGFSDIFWFLSLNSDMISTMDLVWYPAGLKGRAGGKPNPKDFVTIFRGTGEETAGPVVGNPIFWDIVEFNGRTLSS